MRIGLHELRFSRSTTFSFVVCLVPLLGLGCENTDTQSTDAGRTTSGNIVITDANNYRANSTLAIPRVKTAPQADLTVC